MTLAEFLARHDIPITGSGNILVKFCAWATLYESEAEARAAARQPCSMFCEGRSNHHGWKLEEKKENLVPASFRRWVASQ